MLKAGSAARRVSLHFDPPQTSEEVAGMIEEYLQAVDRQLQSMDASWVGHCKLLIDVAGAVVYGSITMAGDDVRWTGAMLPMVPHAEVTVYAAIYNLSDEQVAGVLDKHLPQLMQAAV
ncbi:MAG: hypothetical protein H0X37_12080 [Herpetosiphonaceae bacterium]|nr:hypothetical protein [Herpetosiphonaceae bacterium]